MMGENFSKEGKNFKRGDPSKPGKFLSRADFQIKN